MHEHNGRVLTASKDGSVALSRVGPAGVEAESAYAELCGGGVVKACEWNLQERSSLGPCTFAAAGRRGVVRIVDTRADAALGSGLTIEAAHPFDVHCVRWQPAGEGSEAGSGAVPLLLSASYDPNIRLWDPRALREPVALLSGHVGPAVARQKAIHQPAFCGRDGSNVVASGQGSDMLSLYCTRTGQAISRGQLGWEPSTLAVGAVCGSGGRRECFAVAHGRIVTLLDAMAD
jgi:WD40 repeat protein